MKMNNYWAIVALALGTVPIGTMTTCGGKTVLETTPNHDAGGSGGTKVVSPRPPAIHRTEDSSCVGFNSPAEPPPTGGRSSSSCTQHADCREGGNGKCVHGLGKESSRYRCVYDQCGTDADCNPGKVCYCTANTPARCLSIGNCQTDADCSGGAYSYCSPSMDSDCSGYHSVSGYHCHTAADSCMDDADCTGTDYCDFDVYEARWKCKALERSCIIG